MSEQRPPLDILVNPSDSLQTDPTRNPTTESGNSESNRQSAMFLSKPPEGGGVPVAAWGIAGLAVLAVVIGLIFATRHKSQAPPSNRWQRTLLSFISRSLR